MKSEAKQPLMKEAAVAAGSAVSVGGASDGAGAGAGEGAGAADGAGPEDPDVGVLTEAPAKASATGDATIDDVRDQLGVTALSKRQVRCMLVSCRVGAVRRAGAGPHDLKVVCLVCARASWARNSRALLQQGVTESTATSSDPTKQQPHNHRPHAPRPSSRTARSAASTALTRAISLGALTA